MESIFDCNLLETRLPVNPWFPTMIYSGLRIQLEQALDSVPRRSSSRRETQEIADRECCGVSS